MTLVLSSSPSHFSPNKASAWPRAGAPPPALGSCSSERGKMAAPGCLKRAFEAAARVWSPGIWSCRAWSWRVCLKLRHLMLLRAFVNLRQTLILLDGRGVLFNPFSLFFFFLLELLKKFYLTFFFSTILTTYVSRGMLWFTAIIVRRLLCIFSAAATVGILEWLWLDTTMWRISPTVKSAAVATEQHRIIFEKRGSLLVAFRRRPSMPAVAFARLMSVEVERMHGEQE